jgi:hypothetical protein
VLDQAEALLADADAATTRFYQAHTQAISAAGIVQTPTLPNA